MPPAHTAELGELLARRGFVCHAMVRNQTGHLQLAGSLNGQPVDLLVDTGASATVVDLGYCQSHGIPIKQTAAQGGGAGSAALAIYALEGAELQIGGSPIPPAKVRAIDLSHVNESLIRKGAGPIQGVVGADLLLRHEAVIDYANLSLFLRLAA